MPDSSQVVGPQKLSLDKVLSYNKKSIAIVDRQIN